MRLDASGRLLLAMLLLAPVAVAAQGSPSVAPLTDPPLDTLHPPSMVELAIPSHGQKLNGLLYLPQGAGTHRVLVLLHGYPGVEKNLDLAQALRRAGYGVLYFDYRGSWGTGGTFSYAHALEDVASALAWLRTPEVARRYALDTRRLPLIGHSFGAWLAIMSLATDRTVPCAAAFAPFNRPAEARRWRARPAERAAFLAGLRASTDPGSGPIRARPEDLLRELEAHATDWDLARQAGAIRHRPLLLVTGRRDTSHMTIREDLRRALAGAGRVRDIVLDDDHAFSAHRIATAQLLIDWLARDCSP